MELNKFLILLYKRWLLLVTIPLVAMAVTCFFIKDMPAKFTSQATLATGLVDETRHSLSVDGLTFQESQVSQQFTNIVEMMKLKKMTDKVSFKLLIHDLSQPHPFRNQSKLVTELNENEKRNTINFFKKKYEAEAEINLWDKEEERQYRILKSMKYDEASINSSLNIYRKSNSDYIQVEFTSESPELSPFVVNTLCTEFMQSYDSLIQKNKGKKSDYLAELMRKKYEAMNEKITLLKDYKIQNKILNLYEQSKILYTQILLVDSRKLDAQKDVEAYTGALNSIDSKFDPRDRKYLEGALTKLNQDILVTKTDLYSLSDRYITSEYDNSYKIKKDSLTRKLNTQINALNDQYIYDPLSAKKDLMDQKLSLEVQRDIARNSLNGFTREQEGFNSRFNRLVPFEAVIQSYERDIDIASREYLDILNKYNQLSMDPDDQVKLTQVMAAMPGQSAPTKKILFVLVAGIIAFVLCALILFILFFFDKSVSSPAELVQNTGLPVLGFLNKLKGNFVDLYSVWNENSNPAFAIQKDLLRSIRYEVLQEMGDTKTLCITALQSGQGTTFLAINLAYAFATMHKKVLLIDGNFRNPSVSNIIKPSVSTNDLLTAPYSKTGDFITVSGSMEETRSPFEIADEKRIKGVFDTLPFDIIIIDAGALDTDSKTKEWAACADKIVGVFENKQRVTANDVLQIEWLKQTGKSIGWVFNKYHQSNA